MIAGPSTSTDTNEASVLNGVGHVGSGGIGASFASQCLTDVFCVTNTGGKTPACICGTNTGEHSEP